MAQASDPAGVLAAISALPGKDPIGNFCSRCGEVSLDDLPMNQALEYPRWQEPLLLALLEFDPKQLDAKVKKAEEAIATRIQELASAEGRQREFQLLRDGLSLIRQLKEGRA